MPHAARRTPWLAAAWTGLGTAIACATLAIIVVAACWLPVSATTGRTRGAIRGGLLSFLASVHGGITVDGVDAAWLPLGMLMIVGVTAWRAGSGLADAVELLGERDPRRLLLTSAVQAASFTVGCVVAVPFATLGTSHVATPGVAAGAFSLFALTGGLAFVRSTALREWCAEQLPGWFASVARAGAAAVAVYLAAGALLVAGSLAVHHTEVAALSRSIGEGWGAVPVLLLGVLAAPNAVIAGSSYLAGPGFAVGSGTTVRLLGATHGTLPAFPLLAAVPSGRGADPVVWSVAGLAALVAGIAVARSVARVPGWLRRFAHAGAAAVFAGLIMLVLGWQGGGSVGTGRLHTVGVSPWQLGAMTSGALVLVSGAVLGCAAAWHAVRRRNAPADDEPGPVDLGPAASLVPSRCAAECADDTGAAVDDENEDGGSPGDENEDGALAG